MSGARRHLAKRGPLHQPHPVLPPVLPLVTGARHDERGGAEDAALDCLAGQLDYMVATTGIGFRGWMDAAETWGLASQLVETLGTAHILARGPKARGAVRATDSMS